MRPLYTTSLLLATQAYSLPALPRSRLDASAVNGASLPVRTVYQYPVGTFVESIAPRSNGELLITVTYDAAVHRLDPFKAEVEPVLVHRFGEINATLGLTEYDDDVFAVNGGNYSSTSGSVPGTYRVYSLDLRQENATASKIADLPSAQFLNGMTSLPSHKPGPRALLVNDVAAGVIYHVDPASGEHFVAVNNSLTRAVEHPNLGAAGVNGVHVENSTLYLTNTGQGIFARFAIHPNGTEVKGGDAQVLAHEANSTWFYDDFAVRGSTAYLTTGSGNSLQRVQWSGQNVTAEVVAGSLNSTLVAGPTSAAFGRTEKDRHILYVATSGGLNVPVNGNITVGAQILAVDTTGWSQ